MNQQNPKPETKPEIPTQEQPIERPIDREKEVSITEQSSDEPTVEKSIPPRQRRAEVQNPLMHESY